MFVHPAVVAGISESMPGGREWSGQPDAHGSDRLVIRSTARPGNPAGGKTVSCVGNLLCATGHFAGSLLGYSSVSFQRIGVDIQNLHFGLIGVCHGRK